MRKIYLDNSATTPLDRKVISAMKKYWRKSFGNPSSIHKMGVEAKNVLEKARKVIADFLNAHDREIIFTSGGTEANNLAIFGIRGLLSRTSHRLHADSFNVDQTKNSFVKMHFITTEIEHSSILECFKKLEKDGHEISYLKVDQFGLVNPKDLREMIKLETVLISIGYANSEIGTVEPLREIIKEIRHKKKEFSREKNGLPYFHSDASQAGLYLNMNVEDLGVDLMTLDAQKMYGPKGVGALFVRDGIKIEPIIFGGGQEMGMRSGTENIPLVVGFAKAIEIAKEKKEKESNRLLKLRDGFFDGIKKTTPSAFINGHLEARLPNNINISIPGQDGEMLVFRLDEKGIVCSSASACSSGSGESYVVRKISEKMNLSKEEIDSRAKSTLRFSTGKDTRKRYLKYLLKCLKDLIK
ncbi:MAG: cysteine desulfurase family protein [Candidatus Taylorbacteria bacterium]|nr:cysteine desulfurase family protein [Candidatus Taylorbacteria bacterium]